MFDKYYKEELLYLRELGAEFARAHPASAHMLAAPGSDPDVERLLEGFAFLSARLRQKLDDELPEVTHGLMSLLCPHYLRPVPSMTILEFQPVLAALRQPRQVPRGTEVWSVPVEGTTCRFQTSCEVTLNPLSLDEVKVESGPGPSRLVLRFQIWNQVRPEDLDLRRLRLHLHGDSTVVYTLYDELCNHVREVVLSAGGAEIRGLRLEPVGFSEEEAILAYPTRSFTGYRILQEYFTFPAKFFFLDLIGAEALARLGPQDRFNVEIRFDRALPVSFVPGREEIRLHCVPVVNLFSHEADPIRVDRTRSEYRIRPVGANPLHYEVYSIDRVAATMPGMSEDREISDFHTFEHPAAPPGGIAYYAPRLRASPVDGRTDTYLTFLDARGASTWPEVETISIQMTCTNRRLAEALRVGDLQVPTDSSPEFVRFRNLSPPSPSLPPPLEGDLHWRLLSHLTLSYLSLTDVDVLRGILQLYNFANPRDVRLAGTNARRLEGIRAVRSGPGDLILRGGVVRGTDILLELDEEHFAGPGDLFLFASVLNEFLALHATLNSYTRLTVRGTQQGDVRKWPARSGSRALI